jgi:hypothetical protein
MSICSPGSDQKKIRLFFLRLKNYFKGKLCFIIRETYRIYCIATIASTKNTGRRSMAERDFFAIFCMPSNSKVMCGKKGGSMMYKINFLFLHHVQNPKTFRTNILS